MVSHSRLTAALAAAFVALAAPAGQALAHHAFQAEYECAPITVTGKVTLIEPGRTRARSPEKGCVM